MFAWHHEAAQLAQSRRHDLASGLPEDDAFWRNLVVERKPLGGPAPHSFNDEYPKILDCLQLLEHHDYDAIKVATNLNAKELETFSDDSVFVDTELQAAFQRHFCSTQRGRMALIPGAALARRSHCYLLGRRYPFRTCNDYCRVACACAGVLYSRHQERRVSSRKRG